MNRVSDEIIKRAQGGDPIAFQEIYDAYYQSVFYYALKLSKNEADAYDLAQDTFIQVYRYIKDLREPDYFNFWLFRIVRNKFLRKIHKAKETALEESDLNYLLEQSEKAKKRYAKNPITDAEAFQELLDKLSPKQAEVLRMMYFDQLTIAEMSVILNCPEGTVKSRIAQAKKMLAKKVKDFERVEERKLSFTGNALLPSIFIAGLSKLKTFFQQSLTSQSVLLLSSVSMVVVSGAAIKQTSDTIQNYQHQQEAEPVLQSAYFPSVPYEDETIHNAKEAYYTLLNWANSENTQDSKEDILPVYQALKSTNSDYLTMLEQNSNWINVFQK